MDEEWGDNYEPEGEYDPERDGQVEPDPPEEPDDWSDAEESSDVIPEGEPIDAYSTEETRETWWRLASGSTPPTAPDTEDATTTPTGWTMTRPTVTSDATAAMHAYECERTVYGDSSCLWGAVSMSVDYENEVKAWLAAKVAREAGEVAGATAQHFWHDTDGVHVTDEEQDDWTTEYAKTDHGELGNPTSAKPWHNQLINSLGTLIRTGLRNLVSITQSAIAFYDGHGNNTENIVARFGASGAQIGKQSESRIELDYHSMKLIDKDGIAYLHVSDLRDVNGSATISETFVVDDTEISSNGTRFRLSYDIKTPVSDNIISVMVDDVVLNTSEYVAGTPYYLRIYAVLNLGQKVQIKYSTETAAIAFSFGQRAPDGTVGAESFAEGRNNTASGRVSHAEGIYTQASGSTSHAEGYHTQASNVYSHAEGQYTQAIGSTSHAEGQYTQAIGSTSHAEGGYTGASGDGSHAEGWLTVSSGAYSHAEGYQAQASGNTSHAEGMLTEASGGYSHAEGRRTEANGSYSHAQNYETIARGEAQTAIGKYNIDNTDMDLAFIIGNGTSNYTRSNAFTVDWNGNADPSGNLRLINPSTNRDNPGDSDVLDAQHCLAFQDADGESTGLVRCFQFSDGRVGINFVALNESTAGTEVSNGLSVIVARDGTQSYSVSSPKSFRSAIGLSRVAQTITASNGVASGSVRLIANATMATINVNGLKLSSTLSSGSSVVIGNVPSAYRPYVSTFALVAPTSTAVGRLPLKIWVSATDGTVNLQNYTGSTVGTVQTIEATLTYVI